LDRHEGHCVDLDFPLQLQAAIEGKNDIIRKAATVTIFFLLFFSRDLANLPFLHGKGQLQYYVDTNIYHNIEDEEQSKTHTSRTSLGSAWIFSHVRKESSHLSLFWPVLLRHPDF
jgi:hypothetical protein